ncbi:PEP-CTERM putative exosortase interaction domain-containing protein [Opitutaceae bacterium TAV1]|nr:PEP-CTERM putative exosortase interaction domain-containing protein [Opitutaceae bacterium TAV1]
MKSASKTRRTRPIRTSHLSILAAASALLAATLVSLALPSAARADYINTFEGSEYITGHTLDNVTDSQTGNKWSVFTTNGTIGTGLDVITSDAHPAPAPGTRHLRLNDTQNNANLGAILNLAPAMPAADTFTLSFKVSFDIKGTSGTGCILFGDQSTFADSTKKYWLRIDINGSEITSGTKNALVFYYKTALANPGLASFALKNADGTNFLYTANDYIDLSITIDKTTRQYSSIQLNGIEQLNLGTNPGIVYSAADTSTTIPGSYFQTYTGTNATGIIDIDNIALATPSGIPEPSTWVMLFGLIALALAALRRVR